MDGLIIFLLLVFAGFTYRVIKFSKKRILMKRKRPNIILHYKNLTDKQLQ